jgi:pimeloyl-ACP methyl ester carboxylesterase
MDAVLGLRSAVRRNGRFMERFGRCAALLLVLGATTSTVGASGRTVGALQLEPCTLSAAGWPYTVAAYCGRHAVPENRDEPSGRRIELALAVVPSTAKRPQPDPVFLLAGGPGQSALEAYPAAAAAFGEVLRNRNVVLVDQRGTGGSNPLQCRDADQDPDSPGSAAPDPSEARRAAERCLSTLEADPRFYTTSEAVLDLEAVRQAYGSAQVNLVGVSYGTRVALEYLRRFPDRTRTVVLNAVVPPELALGAEHARNLEASIDAQFVRCERDAACARQYGSPRAALDRLMERLRRAPEPVTYRDPVTHELREEPLTAATVAGMVRLYAYSPQLAAMLPRSLAEAAAGRPEVLMGQARMVETLLGEQFDAGLQLSVICSEDADRLAVDPADAETLMGTAFVATLLAQCEVWPRGGRPAEFNAPVLSDRPVLLLSGEFDPVTPPRYGEQVVQHLPNGRHLIAPGQGHDVLAAGCVPRLVARFIASADAGSLDAACLERLGDTPPFAGAYGWEP